MMSASPEINHMNTTTRKQLGLPEMPVNANYKQAEPPILGIIAVYAFGIVTGLGAAFLAFTFAF
jgi:hypothetical protein